MEDWAIVVIVVGTNIITNLLTWFLTNRQLTRSDKQLERRVKVQREEKERERRQTVRSEPLLKIRSELARMAAKGERVASLVIPLPFGEKSKEDIEEFREALDDWNTYMASGEFQQVLFMQYDFVLVGKVNDIRSEYEGARYRFGSYWQWLSDEVKGKEYEAAVNVVVGNRSKIAEVQSDINKLLEEL